MLYEAPLVAFTVLAQTAVGAHLTWNMYEMVTGQSVTMSRSNLARFLILVLMGLGFVFSTTHLGSPLRAFNAFNRVGSAALSNEILAGASFMALAGLYWLLNVMNIGGQAVRRIVNILSIIAGVVFMFAMANVYLIETVPAWYSAMTTMAFWFTVLTLGVLAGYMLIALLGEPSECVCKTITWIGVVLIALKLAFVTMQTLQWAAISTAIHSGVAQLTTLKASLFGHVLLMVLAAALWLFSERFANRMQVKKLLIVTAFIALLVAEIMGRNVFYGMHFTSGLL